MDRTPPPMSLAAARARPLTPGRSTEVFIDGDLEIRFAARPTNGPQVPHLRDGIYIVAAGTGAPPPITASHQVPNEMRRQKQTSRPTAAALISVRSVSLLPKIRVGFFLSLEQKPVNLSNKESIQHRFR